MWRRVNRAHEIVSHSLYVLGVAALGLIVPFYLYEIVMRYAFGAPTRWVSDFVSFLLLITTFLVIPWLTRQGGHIAVTILPDILSPRLGTLVTRAGFLAGGVVCAVVAYICAVETLTLYQRNSFTMTAVPVPRWILSLCITYGIANSALYFFKITLFGPAAEVGEGDTVAS